MIAVYPMCNGLVSKVSETHPMQLGFQGWLDRARRRCRKHDTTPLDPEKVT